MTIDITYFGYGTGLVMVGWICGTMLRMVLKALNSGVKII